MTGGITPNGIPLDEFAPTSDTTNLDATTSKHGLMPKLPIPQAAVSGLTSDLATLAANDAALSSLITAEASTRSAADSAHDAAIALKAPIASPAFTGTVTLAALATPSGGLTVSPASQSTTFVNDVSARTFSISVSGVIKALLSASIGGGGKNRLLLSSDTPVHWYSGTNIGGNTDGDVGLERIASSALGATNGTAGTYTARIICGAAIVGGNSPGAAQLYSDGSGGNLKVLYGTSLGSGSYASVQAAGFVDGTTRTNLAAGVLDVYPSFLMRWAGTGSTYTGTKVAGIGLNADGALEINNGTATSGAGTFKDLYLGVVKTVAKTVATLPSAATSGAGARSFVTDANATHAAGIGTTVASGGSNKVPVVSDGTNWIIG